MMADTKKELAAVMEAGANAVVRGPHAGLAAVMEGVNAVTDVIGSKDLADGSGPPVALWPNWRRACSGAAATDGVALVARWVLMGVRTRAPPGGWSFASLVTSFS